MTESTSPSLPPAASTPPRSWPIYRAVVGVGILCALAIVVVYELTRPVIQRNRAKMLERAITEVLPGASSSAAFRLNEDGAFEAVSPESEGQDLVHAGYDENHSLIGVAIVAQAMGYQDVIRVLYGYSFEKQAIIGISVLQSRETPGLGDRVETDPDFLRNFDRLDVSLTADGTAPAHPIEIVKPGKKTAAWQVDTISGATVTSQAIAEMLRQSSAQWISRVHPREADFQYRKGGN